MANKYFIEQAKRAHQQAKNQVPAVYSSLAIALHEQGWGYKRINRLFVRSQEIWGDHEGNITDMIQKCEDITGITLVGADK